MSGLLRFLGLTHTEDSLRSTVIEPHQRLLHLKLTWHSMQRHSVIVDKARRQQRLIPDIKVVVGLLLDECTRADRLAPKACLEFALHRDIFHWLVTLAVTGPSGLTKCIISAFTELVEIHDEDFLTHEAVCKNLTVLLTYLNRKLHKESMLDATVQLLFCICSKIHLYPPLLSMFFDESVWLDRLHASASRVLPKSDAYYSERVEEEFLIFYLLMDNMHHLDQNGDFCRTGLLYLIDAAKNDTAVQQWIAESELPILLTVGLGSHYSSLGSKLRVEYNYEEDLLLASSYNTKHDHPLSAGITSSSSSEFVDALDKFLTYLSYWQDVLRLANSQELKSTLLDSFKVLFLKCILYPSLIESSDNDGGSVAVSTYLALILDVITEPDMADVSLQYLFASEILTADNSLASKRATFMAGERLNTSLDPTLFTLKDMIFDNLQSNSMDTRVSTLRLVETLIRQYWPHVMNVMIQTGPAPSVRKPTIGHHRKEMQTLASLIGRDYDVTTTAAYQDYLYDARTTIEAQLSSLDELFLVEDSHASSVAGNGLASRSSRPRVHHTIATEDRLIAEILQSLSSFFTNEIELNLVLTKIVVDLASCPERSLEGWLLFSRADSWIGLPGTIAPDYSLCARGQSDIEDQTIGMDKIRSFLSDDDEEEEDDASLDFGTESSLQATRSKVLPSWSRFPPFLTLFKSLATQIRQYKSEIDSLETDLEERYRALHSCDDKVNIDAALTAGQPSAASPAKPATYARSPSFLFKRSPSKMGNPSMETPQTPQRSAPESPYSAHFSSTRRSVTTLHSIRLHDDQSSIADPIHQTPTKSNHNKSSLLDANITPERPSRSTPLARADLDGPQTICLSKLINNIIIFEEFIQEIMATVQVRRALCDNCEFV